MVHKNTNIASFEYYGKIRMYCYITMRQRLVELRRIKQFDLKWYLYCLLFLWHFDNYLSRKLVICDFTL